jgi:hypothetical protein
MSNASEGNAAIEGLDGKDKGGRKLTVNQAIDETGFLPAAKRPTVWDAN